MNETTGVSVSAAREAMDRLCKIYGENAMNETTIPPRPKAGNVRWWPHDNAPGWLVEMAATGGWLMVQRHGEMPFVTVLCSTRHHGGPVADIQHTPHLVPKGARPRANAGGR